MSCSITRNKEGKITAVKTTDGKRSKLFDEIHGNIFLSSPELSLKIMSEAYTNANQEKYGKGKENTYSTGEPKLYYRSPNNKEFDNLEEALISDEQGKISMGFKDPTTDSYTEIANFSTNTSERSRFLTDQVTQGVISAKRVLDKEDGITRFQGKGEFTETQYATARIFQFNAATDMGIGNVKINKDGTIEVEFPTDVVIGFKDGRAEAIREEDLLGKTYDNQQELLVNYHLKNLRPLTSAPKTKVTPRPPLNIKATTQALWNFLGSIGFTKTTLDQYRKNYNTRYGNDPDIQALTDIANKVVAFSQGEIPFDQLSEEVAHIAIEAYNDQNSIMSAIANAHLTPEYKEFSDYYRQKYAPFYENSVNLEEQVRKEILGKILAKEFTNRFQTQTTSEEQGYLLQKLREIWDAFMNMITGNVKVYHRNALSDLNKKIADSVLNNDIAQFQNDITTNENFFYSAMSRESQSTEQDLQKAKFIIENLFRSTGQKVPKAAELDNISDLMTEISVLRSINTIAGIAEKQMGILEASVSEAEAKGELLGIKEEAIYQTLEEQLVPVLKSLKLGMEKIDLADPKNKKIIEGLNRTIDTIGTRQQNIKPKIDKDKNRQVYRMADEVFNSATNNMTEKQRKETTEAIEGGFKDQSLFAYLFGVRSNSQNPVIKLIVNKVIELNTRVRAKFLNKINPVIDSIYDNGWDKYQKNLIKKVDGKGTFYFISPVNWKKRDDEREAEQVRIASEITGRIQDEIKAEMKRNPFNTILGNAENFKQFQDSIKKYDQTKNQKIRTEEYYRQRDERFDKANVSEYTREVMGNFSARRFEILKPYMDSKTGIVDQSKLTEGERRELFDLKKEREITKSAYDAFGNLRDGLRMVKWSELTQAEQNALPYTIIGEDFSGELVVLQPGYKLEDLSDEARVSIDMNTLGMVWATEGSKSNGTPVEAFIKQIEELEKDGGSDAYSWASSNATIGLSSEYFENLDSFVGFDQTVQKYIDSLEDSTERENLVTDLEYYKDLNRQRKNLLKQNRQMNNQLEIDVNNMDINIKEEIIRLDSEIARTRSNMRVPKELFQRSESTTVREVNDHFEKLRREFGLSEYEFALKHMTEDNYDSTKRFAREITSLINGRRRYISKSFEDFLQEAVRSKSISRATMTDPEIIETLKNEYAKSKVTSYFQRYTPQGYSKLLTAMKSGEVKMSDVINNKESLINEYPALKHLEIRPDYSWTEEVNNDQFMNPYYKKGGYYQKPIEADLDDEWFNRYGISKQSYLELESDDLVTTLVATKNKEEFELWKSVINMRESVLSEYGETETVNKYQRVQQSKKLFEDIFGANLTNIVPDLKEKLKDITRNRVDDKIYGEQLDGIDLNQKGVETSIRVIPKYFQQKLTSPEVLTENIIGAAMLDYQQALLYNERKRAEKDVRALEWKLQNQVLLSNGGILSKKKITKSGEVTMTYQAGKEYLNHHIYGIQQTRSYVTTIMGKEVDLTQIVNAVQSIAQFRNLAFNAFVDLTGLSTGKLSNIADRIVGEYYHKSSYSKARSQVNKYLPNYALEFGKIQKNSEMSALLEFFDVTDVTYRLKNTQFNKAVRIIGRSPYVGSKASNMGVTPRILFSILNDYRYSDGHFRSFNEFTAYRRMQNNLITNQTIEAEWKKLEQDSYYENLKITPKKISFNDKFKAKYENPQQEFEKLHTKITAKSKQVIQIADGVLSETDRVAAQRDFAANLVMMHRGWLPLNLTKRFKKPSFNISTGNFEEGHYRSLWKLLQNTVSRTKGKPSFREYWESLEPFEKRNLRRAGIEHLALASGIALGLLVLAGDDEDDTWMEDLGQLIYLRTMSEYTSGQLPGIPGSLLETFKSPVTTISTIEMLEPISFFRTMGQEDQEGNNKWWKRLKKATILTRYGQYSDLQEQINSFRHFNTNTLLWLGEEKKSEE